MSSELLVRNKINQLSWLTIKPDIENVCRFDLMVAPTWKTKIWLRIQIKTIRIPKQGMPDIRISKPHAKKMLHYSDRDFDILVGYVPETNQAYVLNWEDIGERKYTVAVKKNDLKNWSKLSSFYENERKDFSKEEIEILDIK